MLVGSGTSLVLDEFALILRLEDVYWADEGRISVEMVSLAIAGLGLVLLGLHPLNFLQNDDGSISVGGVLVAIAIAAPFFYVSIAKGKYRLTLFALFVFPAAVVGAIRLAKPRSRWAKRYYKPEKMDRAVSRAAAHGARYGPIATWVSDFVAGKPSAAAGMQPAEDSRRTAAPRAVSVATGRPPARMSPGAASSTGRASGF